MSQVTQSILFRQKLYQNFKQSGLLSQLKTSLRTNLLQKLQKPQYASSIAEKSDKNKPLYLRDKFLACIVQEYLVKSGKQYSLSILLPESGLEEQDCLNFNELSEIINLNQIQHEDNGKPVSFLEILVHQWTKFRSNQIRERSTQTDFSQPVSKKLQDIDKQYRPKIDYWSLVGKKEKPQQEQNTKLALLTQQQRMKQEFELQKKRIKRDMELLIKAEMQKKYRDKFDFRERQIQKAHQGRLTEMKNRQKQILQSLDRKKKDLEEKARKISEDEMKMIHKYQLKIKELEIEFKEKIKEVEKKEKQIWKKDLQLKAKKKQYQESIRLVKQKVIEQTLSDFK